MLYFLARSDTGAALVTDIAMNLTRGVRNNNPGNIRLNPVSLWAGQVPAVLQTDKAFVQFEKPEYGIRAMAKILKSYAGRGLITVEKIISTYAPSAENDTRAYIAHVVNDTGFDPKAPLNLAQMMKMIPPMISHENAGYKYPASVINTGISMS